MTACIDKGRDLVKDVLSLHYVNHRGEHALRRVRPIRIWYGSTAWYSEPQWLIEVFCLDRLATRDFSLAKIVASTDARLQAIIAGLTDRVAAQSELLTRNAQRNTTARAEQAEAERDRLREAIRTHRSQKADDRCVEDDDRLYAVLGDGILCDRRVGCREAMLANCGRFIDRRCEEGGWPTYVELEAVRDRLLAVCKALWADRDAKQSDQAACRRLYNAWLDLRDAIAPESPKPEGVDS